MSGKDAWTVAHDTNDLITLDCLKDFVEPKSVTSQQEIKEKLSALKPSVSDDHSSLQFK